MDKKLGIFTAVAFTLLSSTVFAEEATEAKTPAAPAEQKQAAKPKADPFSLTTNAFLDQGALPVLYTCDGKDVSPQLSWSNPPGKTKSYAIMVSDKDAPDGTFYHWVMFNVPKSVDNLTLGVKNAPSGASIGMNSFKKQQYSGPCPPKGSAHTYVFSVYALDNKLSLPKNANAEAVLKAMKNHVVGKAELSVVYSRWINA